MAKKREDRVPRKLEYLNGQTQRKRRIIAKILSSVCSPIQRLSQSRIDQNYRVMHDHIGRSTTKQDPIPSTGIHVVDEDGACAAGKCSKQDHEVTEVLATDTIAKKFHIMLSLSTHASSAGGLVFTLSRATACSAGFSMSRS